MNDLKNDVITHTDKYSSINYSPMNLVLSKGKGAKVWDIENNEYIDCISGFSVVNHGHCHPKIIKAFQEQSEQITMVSRALYSDNLGVWEEKICTLANKDKVLPMNTGAEAVETAIKIARKWGEDVKGVPEGRSEIIAMNGNFHGRTLGALSLSSQESYKQGFGPLLDNMHYIDFGDVAQLKSVINEHTSAIILEPIQGEGGVNIPSDNFIAQVRELCDEHNILFIADEIQVGLGRTGKMFATEWEGVTADIYLLGKSLGGGLYPISAVLADESVMNVLTPGTHGSTFGGNPLACAVSTAALDVLIEEKLIENSATLGQQLLNNLQLIDSDVIVDVRGRGLFIGIELTENAQPYCLEMIEKGVLCKETQGNIIRISPPLVIDETEITKVIDVITEVLQK
ncbi:ornithine--oxo-acid transaminase [Staphylococcus arlettae]|mgnify:FL=1|uniref:ornithine--oxo-acid transaminase n=1 Tax=Staphylococcus TaxID=1279 RepID=UPI0002823936|nr:MULTISPECIES: ornithine--oxo-acid transaminase [Staphylococcus]EJY96909.1 ornithine aminotransferase [Staphylococcus arlettae CVD059]MCD8842104.1 ornithine--oxo-acid transaminase [Staphylococcus arlettae]MCD8907417.1 ornithine--oxo-acid transaminase [Staphylococcus arlettae]MCE4984258.1 ornithine--oxo-acid transaminase [Staphylococcus arlettae]MDT3893354.1 ornithine--oxo-acid transaminase [Staphylococcus arlettae]